VWVRLIRIQGLRLAELVAAFSLATDLGMGQPMEHVLRSQLSGRRRRGRDRPGAVSQAVAVLVRTIEGGADRSTGSPFLPHRNGRGPAVLHSRRMETAFRLPPR